MKISIMQPYLFPYIGYFQLIYSSDLFVIYDDVNFIKQGYINRNSILNKDKPQLFSLQVKGASSFKMINEVEVGSNKSKLLQTIRQNYSRAPFFEKSINVVEDILLNNEDNLAKYVGQSIKKICEYLGIETKIIYSSDLDKDNNLKSKYKVMEICRLLDSDCYINSIGGKDLYSKEEFKHHGIDLNFLKPNINPYSQFGEEFVPYLSIIDIIMFNDVSTVKNFLKNYTLE